MAQANATNAATDEATRGQGEGGGMAALVDALVGLSDADEARAFLADLCTPRELDDLSQRLEVARMLDAGGSYAHIQDVTGASATTVARVARCLKYGPGGYRAVLDRLAAREA